MRVHESSSDRVAPIVVVGAPQAHGLVHIGVDLVPTVGSGSRSASMNCSQWLSTSSRKSRRT